MFNVVTLFRFMSFHFISMFFRVNGSTTQTRAVEGNTTKKEGGEISTSQDREAAPHQRRMVTQHTKRSTAKEDEPPLNFIKVFQPYLILFF